MYICWISLCGMRSRIWTKASLRISRLLVFKAQNAIFSTSFLELKKKEKYQGFSESITSKKNNEQIPFFHLGPENDWRKCLNKNLQTKLNSIFKKNLVELGY